MNFNEFKEMISYYDYPVDESYKLAYIWLHPEYIPKKQISLGKYGNVYKIKPFITNYNSLITNLEKYDILLARKLISQLNDKDMSSYLLSLLD